MKCLPAAAPIIMSVWLLNSWKSISSICSASFSCRCGHDYKFTNRLLLVWSPTPLPMLVFPENGAICCDMLLAALVTVHFQYFLTLQQGEKWSHCSLSHGTSSDMFSLNEKSMKVHERCVCNLCDSIPCLGQNCVMPIHSSEVFPQDVGGS